MKSTEKIIEKNIYKSPEIVCISLDNEISLALESVPPLGPGEFVQSMQFNPYNPFKDTV